MTGFPYRNVCCEKLFFFCEEENLVFSLLEQMTLLDLTVLLIFCLKDNIFMYSELQGASVVGECQRSDVFQKYQTTASGGSWLFSVLFHS